MKPGLAWLREGSDRLHVAPAVVANRGFAGHNEPVLQGARQMEG